MRAYSCLGLLSGTIALGTLVSACAEGTEPREQGSATVSPSQVTPSTGSTLDPTDTTPTTTDTNGTPTVTPAVPPPNDPCETAALCEDFEQHTVGAEPMAPWTVNADSGTVVVSSERAFSGSQSVHCQADEGSYSQAFISLAGEPVFPALGNELFGRVMLWAAETPEGSVHWTFVAGDGPTADGDQAVYRIGGQHDGAMMNNYWTDDAQKDCWDHSSTVVPTQTWVCLEWRYATATNEIQVWLDGTELTDLHMTGEGEGCVGNPDDLTWPAPTAFEQLSLGWTHYQDTTQKDVWLDDFAVSSERVGCPAP